MGRLRLLLARPLGLVTMPREVLAGVWRRDLFQLALTTFLVLLLIPDVRALFWRYAVFDQRGYSKPFLVAWHLRTWSLPIFLGIPTYLLLVTKTALRWEDIENGRRLRTFLMPMLGVLVWQTAFGAYNFYLDRGYPWDRTILLALTLLSWRTPLAFPWATMLMLTLKKQNDVPFLVDQTDWRALVELLIVFSLFLWVSAGRKIRARHFLFLTLTHVGAYYLYPGLSKARRAPAWSWLFENKISNMTFAAWQHEWLGFLSEDAIVSLMQIVEPFTLLLGAATLIIEIGALLMFVHRRVAMAAALSFAILHFGIFLLTGICFWKWIVMDLSLFYFIWKMPAQPMRRYFLPGILIPVAGALIMYYAPGKAYYPPPLTWHSAKVSRAYPMEVVTRSGRAYRLDPNFLGQFAVYFHQNNFMWLDKTPHVTGIYAGAEREPTLELEKAKTAEEARAILKKYGRIEKNEGAARGFDHLVRTYFKHHNARIDEVHWFGILGPPVHLWNQMDGDVYDGKEPVARVNIYTETLFFNGEAVIEVVPKTLVRKIEVPK